MRNLIAKPFRFLFGLNYLLRSRIRKWLIQLKYPTCSLGRGVAIGRNVQFIVSDGGSVRIGDDACIKDNCVIIAKHGPLNIGKNTFIGWGAVVCANRGITIGDDCLIAEYVTIRDQNHGINLTGQPFRSQPMISNKIQIGSNVWIGAKATVLAGSKIEHDSVVAAHCVVNTSVESGVVVGGLPATVIKKLKVC